MEKLSFKVDKELKEAFLEELGNRGIKPDLWLTEQIENFLIGEIEARQLMAVNSELAISDSLPPGNAVPMGGFSLTEDLPPDLVQKIIIDSIREGFAKYGVQVDSKSFTEIEENFNKQIN